MINKHYLGIILIFLTLISSFNTLAQTKVIGYEIKKKHLFNEIEALGTLKANETVRLTSTVTDTITNIYFEDGQRVEKGFLLAEMTNQEESALVKESLARVEEAKKQFERVKNIPQQGAISGSVVDQRRREFESANALLEAMKSRLEDRLIIAPFSGVMGLRNVSAGALVTPGEEIGTITDDQIMNLDFSVPAVLLNALSVGLKVYSTTSAFPKSQFAGEIVALDSRVDPITRSIVVRAKIPNSDGLLKPGLLMQVKVRHLDRESLVVPEEAILPLGSKVGVFQILDNKVKQVIVEVGIRKNGEVEILSGLQAGDLVVTHGAMALTDDKEVVVDAIQQAGEGLKDIIKRKKVKA